MRAPPFQPLSRPVSHRAPRHNQPVRRLQQRPPFLGGRRPDGARGRWLPRAQALLRGRAAPAGREGGRGRARTLPQRRPAWRGCRHRRLGRCGGLPRGGERGSGRLASPARPGGAAAGPAPEGLPEVWGALPLLAGRDPRQSPPASRPASALGASGSPASRSRRPGQRLSFSEFILVVVEVVGITHLCFPLPLGTVRPVEVLPSGSSCVSAIFLQLLRAAAGSGPLLSPWHIGSYKVMAAAIEPTSFEEEQLPIKRETMTWKPRKEWLLKNIPNVLDSESEESEFSGISHNENDVSGSPVDSVHRHPDLEDLGGEDSSMPEAVTFPKLQTASVYEVEDWDKELGDTECNPYDAGDLYCGSFQENNLLASYSWQEDSFYNPGCHHAACLAFTPPVRMTEAGQFDDADE